MGGFVLFEFLRLALALVGADEVLQGGFVLCDHGLRAVDFCLQFADAIFYLLALDGIQTLSLGRQRVNRRSIAI